MPTSNKPTLYIHMGYPKTGSTALQNFLKVNRTTLKKNGVHVPWNRGSGKSRQLPAHVHFLNRMKFMPFRKNCVISNEAFVSKPWPTLYMNERGKLDESLYWAAKKNFLHHVRAKYERTFRIVPIIYLRPQIDFLVSLYTECVRRKWGGMWAYAGQIDEFLEYTAPLLEYDRQIEAIQDVFGAENVNVRFYDDLIEGDIRKDFLNALNLDCSSFDYVFPAKRLNQGLSEPVLDYAREYNEKFIGKTITPEHRDFLATVWTEISRHLEQRYGKMDITVTKDLAEKITERYFRHNRQLAAIVGTQDINEKLPFRHKNVKNEQFSEKNTRNLNKEIETMFKGMANGDLRYWRTKHGKINGKSGYPRIGW